jgi:hypothetical protein
VKLIKCNARNVNIDNYHYYIMARVRNLEVLWTGVGESTYFLGASSDLDEGGSDACSSCGDDVNVVFSFHT